MYFFYTEKICCIILSFTEKLFTVQKKYFLPVKSDCKLCTVLSVLTSLCFLAFFPFPVELHTFVKPIWAADCFSVFCFAAFASLPEVWQVGTTDFHSTWFVLAQGALCSLVRVLVSTSSHLGFNDTSDGDESQVDGTDVTHRMLPGFFTYFISFT